MDYFNNREYLHSQADRIVYTGPINQYFNYCYGVLEYRSLKFEHIHLDIPNYQGNAVVNYTEATVPFTRIIEHKHFEFGQQPTTVITKEYPEEWKPGMEPYYPVNDEINTRRFKKYQQRALLETDVIFGGRLAEYRYYDMHQVIGSALVKAEKVLAVEKVIEPEICVPPNILANSPAVNRPGISI